MNQSTGTCEKPDVDNTKLVCGYPIPCPHHTVVVNEKSISPLVGRYSSVFSPGNVKVPPLKMKHRFYLSIPVNGRRCHLAKRNQKLSLCGKHTRFKKQKNEIDLYLFLVHYKYKEGADCKECWRRANLIIKNEKRIYVSCWKYLDVVVDRFNKMSFKEIAEKHKFSNGAQARAHYLNTLNYLIHNAKPLQTKILNEIFSERVKDAEDYKKWELRRDKSE